MDFSFPLFGTFSELALLNYLLLLLHVFGQSSVEGDDILGKRSNDFGRVIGGHPAKEGVYPFIVQIRMPGYHRCGGSIINDNTILTAAHCVIEGGQLFEGLSVLAGSYHLKEGDHFEVDSVIVHPDYNEHTFHQDVAVLKLKTKLPLEKTENDASSPKIARVCLPNESDNPKAEACKFIGWGKTVRGESHDQSVIVSENLLEADLAMISPPTDVCFNTLRTFDDKVSICAFNDDKSSFCNGDSGGPYLCPLSSGEWLQYGIVSHMLIGCVGGAVYFTRVTRYLDWIREQAEK